MSYKFQVIMAQVRQSQLRAEYYRVRVETGAYKDKLGKVWLGGSEDSGGTPATEEQLLHRELENIRNILSVY